MHFSFSYPKEHEIQKYDPEEVKMDLVFRQRLIHFITFMFEEIKRLFNESPSSYEEISSCLSSDFIFSLISSFLKKNDFEHFNLDDFPMTIKSKDLPETLFGPLEIFLQIYFICLFPDFYPALNSNQIRNELFSSQESFNVMKRLFIFLALKVSQNSNDEKIEYFNLTTECNFMKYFLSSLIECISTEEQQFMKRWNLGPCDANWEKFYKAFPKLSLSKATKFFFPIELNDPDFIQEILSYLPERIIGYENAKDAMEIWEILKLFICMLKVKYLFDWKEGMFVLKPKQEKEKEIEEISSQMILNSSDIEASRNSNDLKCLVCNKKINLKAIYSRSNFHVLKCSNPNLGKIHCFHIECLYDFIFDGNYSCPVCKFDFFSEFMNFIQILVQSLAYEPDKLGGNFDIFKKSIPKFDVSHLLFQFTKVSLTFDEVYLISSNMEIYLKNHANDEMKEFLYIFKLCTAERHFFEISKRQLYDEIMSGKHNSNNQVGYSILINCNNEFISCLTNEQIGNMICEFIRKSPLNSSNEALFYFIFYQFHFTSRKMPESLLAKIVISAIKSENHRICSFLEDLNLNSFQNEEALKVFEVIIQLKDLDLILNYLKRLNFNFERVSPLKIFQILARSEDWPIIMNSVMIIFQADSYFDSLDFDSFQLFLDFFYENFAKFQEKIGFFVWLARISDLIIENTWQFSSDQIKRLFYHFHEKGYFLNCVLLLAKNNRFNFFSTDEIAEIIIQMDQPSSSEYFFRQKIIVASNFVEFYEAIKAKRGIEFLDRFLQNHSLSIIGQYLSEEKAHLFFQTLKANNLIKFSLDFLPQVSREDCKRISDEEYEKIKEYLLSSFNGDKQKEIILSNWIESSLFWQRINDSLPFTMKSIKNPDSLSRISYSFFNYPNIDEFESYLYDFARVFVETLQARYLVQGVTDFVSVICG